MRFLVAVLLAVAVAVLPAQAAALQTPVTTGVVDLTGSESGLDGAAVVFEGEVVSELLAGGPGHGWLNVLDGGMALGVWLPNEMAREVRAFGDWKSSGDVVRVTGTFNQVCAEHGGDMDVHATALVVLDRGEERTRPVSYWKLAIVGAGALVALFGYRRLRRAEQEGLDA
ncbi:MAG: hypothetical protein ACYC6J_06930 [Coriobacteriia bacterium]